jgi:type IV pilus assembly protein PilB
MEEITKTLSIDKSLLDQYQKDIKNISLAKDIILSNIPKETTDFLDSIILSSIALNTSDIHLEPEKETAKLRFRVDGILHDVCEIPTESSDRLTSRFKLLSGLKLNIRDKAQDGRFSIVIPDTGSIEARSSSIPTNNGESLVIRILNSKNLLNIPDLGLNNDMYALLEKEIAKPNGMILVTGPTGSGKTTTLYAILQNIKSSENKIITIEDPIEYKLDDITQTQVDVKKGYDFESGLKSIVRQDPDVILVGEIRDEGTCDTAIQAALTGHLVLSTLHTNDAVGAIARLQALKAQDHNIGPAINIIIGQRLIRKVCPECATKTEISSDTKKEIKKITPLLSDELKEKISGIDYLLEPKGCEFCNNTGYKGRIGIYEILPVDADFENAIIKKESSANLLDLAISKGMITMRQDGIIKALLGITTMSEINKATSLE